MSDEFRDMDVNQQIGELMDRIHDLRENCRYRSSSRISRELKRFAKAEKQVVPYLHANFYLMNDAQSLLDVETGIEAAVVVFTIVDKPCSAPPEPVRCPTLIICGGHESTP